MSAIPYCLVPKEKLKLAEDRENKATKQEKKSWQLVHDHFKNSEEARSVIALLKALESVNLRGELLLVNNNLKTAIGVHTFVKNLSSDTSLKPDVEKFLNLIKEAESDSVPEAINICFSLHCSD